MKRFNQRSKPTKISKLELGNLNQPMLTALLRGGQSLDLDGVGWRRRDMLETFMLASRSEQCEAMERCNVYVTLARRNSETMHKDRLVVSPYTLDIHIRMRHTCIDEVVMR